MADDNRPLSDLVAQGWEILHYAASNDTGGAVVENFLLRRQKAHRILSIRPKMMGTGYVVKELDV
ncbi:MAG TPA: hypothetical protein VG942_12445 [Hyphomonadaceae bacterium]|nr:hypothetical protein [Hyphomonadaceae bacterium]